MYIKGNPAFLEFLSYRNLIHNLHSRTSNYKIGPRINADNELSDDHQSCYRTTYDELEDPSNPLVVIKVDLGKSYF